MSIFNYPYKCGYPYWYPSNDVHERTFYNGYSLTRNIHEWITMFLWILFFNYPCSNGYPFGYPWISVDIHAWTYWILDPRWTDFDMFLITYTNIRLAHQQFGLKLFFNSQIKNTVIALLHCEERSCERRWAFRMFSSFSTMIVVRELLCKFFSKSFWAYSSDKYYLYFWKNHHLKSELSNEFQSDVYCSPHVKKRTFLLGCFLATITAINRHFRRKTRKRSYRALSHQRCSQK